MDDILAFEFYGLSSIELIGIFIGVCALLLFIMRSRPHKIGGSKKSVRPISRSCRCGWSGKVSAVTLRCPRCGDSI